jgi:hypothetical protein
MAEKGLTCGAANSTNATGTNATLELRCIGGADPWEGGYVAVYVTIAILFVGCVGFSVLTVKRSKENCFDMTLHDVYETPLAPQWFVAAWRGLFFITFLLVEIVQLATSGYAVFQAYTVWNFCFQVITLGIGFHLALGDLFPKAGIFFKSETYEHAIRCLHLLLDELCLPLSMLVCFVVWCVSLWRGGGSGVGRGQDVAGGTGVAATVEVALVAVRIVGLFWSSASAAGASRYAPLLHRTPCENISVKGALIH